MSITNIKPIDKRNDVFSAMYDNNDIIIKVVDKKEKATLETLKDAKFNNIVKIYNIYTYNDFFVKFHCDLSIIQGIIFKQNILYYLSSFVVIMEKLNTYTDNSVHQKIKNMSDRLHINDVNGRSDCFWCTCPYESPPIYIPKSILNGTYQVYGSFCSPECAAAYLFQQKTDQSTKFEQYHLLNDLYGEAYSYKKPIVPAPSPYYILNKYYGTLTIQEYRQLIKQDGVLITVDKPICCIYPELIQCSTEYITQKQEYRLCRKTKS